jgi:Protein of unknown function (DUF3168)
MIESDLFTALSTPTVITALVGTRIYPVRLPPDPTLPAIHYKFVGGSSQATQDTLGSQRSRAEVSCWGATYSDAVTLRAAVVAALSQTSSGSIQLIQFLQNVDFDEPDTLDFRALCEFYLYSNL